MIFFYKYLTMLKTKGFFHLLSVNFLTQFLGLGGLLLLTAFLTPKELGMAKIMHSYTAFFILLGTFGFNSAILKVCSESDATTDINQKLMGGAIRKVILMSLVSYILMVLLWKIDLLPVTPEIFNWLLIFCIVIPFASISNLMITYLQAQKKVQLMAKTQAVVRLLFFVIVVLSTYMYGFSGFIYASVLSYVCGFLMFVKTSGLSFSDLKNHKSNSRMNTFAKYSFLGGIISVLSQHADIYILEGIGVSHAEIGFYSIAVLFMMGANQISATTQMIATPYFSERASDPNWILIALIKYQALLIGLSILVAIGVYFFAFILVKFFYGNLYANVLTYLPILLTRYVIWSAYAITGVALLGMGAIKEGTAIAAVVTPMGLIVSYVLSKYFGVVGVAWGQVIAAIMSLVAITTFAFFLIKAKFNSLEVAP